MFYALSRFQLQHELLKKTKGGVGRWSGEDGRRGDDSFEKSLFPNTTLSDNELNERITDLMDTLRPMLTQALANCSLD